MYTLDAPHPGMQAVAARAKELLVQVISRLDLKPESRTLPGGSALSASTGRANRGELLVLVEGVLKLVEGDKLLYFLDDNDLVGFGPPIEAVELQAFAEFAVKIDAYNWTDFQAALAKDPDALLLWNDYHAAVQSWHLGLIGNLTRDDGVFSPAICTYQRGETIIEQGSTGDQVFTLIEGSADVLVDGAKVGIIKPDEMFGAVALLTKQARSASVVAVTDCMVVVLSKDQFMTLARSRPDAMLKLAEDLSRAILRLNDQISKKIQVPT